MADTIDIVIPDLGDFSDVEVIEVLVKAGDHVKREEGLITLETDKATMDVQATQHGSIEELTVAVGDKVSAGDVIGHMQVEVGDTVVVTTAIQAELGQGDTTVVASREESAPSAAAPPTPQPAESLPPIDESGFSKAHASPSVRKLARELGVNLAQVKGSGPKNRILPDDVKAYVKAILTSETQLGGGLPTVPGVDFSKFGEIETVPLTRIQKISGPRLQASWMNIPHVTQHDHADVTRMERKRQDLKASAKEQGFSLTPLAFILKACIAALKEFPRANSSLS